MTNSIGVSLESYAMVGTQSSRHSSSNGFKFTKTKGKSDVLCSYCRYFGRFANKFFQLIGYPSGWKDPRGKRSLNTQSGGGLTLRLSNINNASSSEQNYNISSMIFSQEKI